MWHLDFVSLKGGEDSPQQVPRAGATLKEGGEPAKQDIKITT